MAGSESGYKVGPGGRRAAHPLPEGAVRQPRRPPHQEPAGIAGRRAVEAYAVRPLKSQECRGYHRDERRLRCMPLPAHSSGHP